MEICERENKGGARDRQQHYVLKFRGQIRGQKFEVIFLSEQRRDTGRRMNVYVTPFSTEANFPPSIKFSGPRRIRLQAARLDSPMTITETSPATIENTGGGTVDEYLNQQTA